MNICSNNSVILLFVSMQCVIKQKQQIETKTRTKQLVNFFSSFLTDTKMLINM